MGCLNKTIMAMAMAMVFLAAAMVAEAQQSTPSCASKLVPCASYLNSTKPPEECCSSIKQAVSTELPCLCNLYNTPGLLQSFGVSVDQALRLTEACGVPVRLNQCNSTSSPQAQPTPAVPGSDGNGAERTVWTGISTLFLVFGSMLFY